MARRDEERDTAHKHEAAPTDQAAPGGSPGAPMPMGMTGAMTPTQDPDQKSTHNTPQTVESNLPDGSPKYADAGSQPQQGTQKQAGKYEAVNRFTTKVGDNVRVVEPGEVVELKGDEATSLGDNIKPAS